MFIITVRLPFGVRPTLLLAGAAVLLTFAAHSAGIDAEDLGTAGDGSYTVGPDYKMDPDLTDPGESQRQILRVFDAPGGQQNLPWGR